MLNVSALNVSGQPVLTQAAAVAGYQALDTDLTTIAALTTTSFGRGFLPLADAASTRAYIAAGTVNSVSVVTANGISGTVANPTTTPAITLNIVALDAAKIGGGGVSTTEFNYLGNVTSDVQAQLNARALLTTNTFTGIQTISNTTASASSTTGALIVAGGIGVAKDASINGVTIGLGGGNVAGNTAIGLNALKLTTTGGANTAIGSSALSSNTTGQTNSGFGATALFNNTTGWQNTAIGSQALYSNTSGGSNTATGSGVLYSNTIGVQNTASGVNSLYSNTTGNQNTAYGFRSLYSNISGWSNIATGTEALFLNTTGAANAAMGDWALYRNTAGTRNIAIGQSSLSYNTTGGDNLAFGFGAGMYQADGVAPLATAQFSIYLGPESRGFNNSDNNAIVIGYQAIGEGANTTVIGNANTVSTHIYGLLNVSALNISGQPVLTQAAAASTYLTSASAASSYQVLDTDLTSIAALTTTSFGRGFLPLVDAASTRAYIAAGTVNTVSVVTANGISGSVANATTTPAITLDIAALDATKIGAGVVSNTEFGYLDGVTSAIQTQLNAKGVGDMLKSTYDVRNLGYISGGTIGTGLGGSLKMLGGTTTNAGSIDTSSGFEGGIGGSIILTGGSGGVAASKIGGAGGSLTMIGGSALGTSSTGGAAGSINTRGGLASGVGAIGGAGGSIQLIGAPNAAGATSGAAGSILSNGGQGDVSRIGGTLNMSASATLPGGSITTSGGGGYIDTTGTGTIQLGVVGTRTTLNGNGAADRTVRFPSATTGTKFIPLVASGSGLPDLASEITGTLPLANGGTGQTSAQDSINALLPAQASNAGKVLQTDGTNTSWVTVAGGGGTAAAPLTLASGIITTSVPALSTTQTWNAGAVTFTGIQSNITDTASAAGSKLLDLQVGGVSKFSVDKAGNIVAASNLTVGGQAVLTQAAAATTYTTPAQVLAGYQPLNAGLTSIAALATTSYGRSLLTGADATATRTTLGLGSLATQSGTIANYLTIANATTTYQAVDPDLTSIAAVATTSFGRGFLAITDAAAARTYIGAGSGGGGTGDVVGPATSVGNRLAVFSNTTGKLLKDSGETVTTSQPYTVAQTWNAAAVTFTGIHSNITDTASAAGSKIIDLQVGGVSKFNVDKEGNAVTKQLIITSPAGGIDMGEFGN